MQFSFVKAIKKSCRKTILTGIALLASVSFHAAASEIATPLSTKDASTYEKIFIAQEKGDWDTANRLIKDLKDRSLMGHVLYQRYMHPTAYRSTYAELKGWMGKYADHPKADVIYSLAKKRRTRGSKAPTKPNKRRWRTQDDPYAYLAPSLVADYKNAPNVWTIRGIENRVRYLNKEDRPTQALNYINDSRQKNKLTSAQFDRIRSWIAASYYYNNKLAKAERIANSVARKNGDVAVLSYWISGLTAYRRGDIAKAASYFDQMASVEFQTPELRSAAGFWAARTHLASGSLERVVPNLKIAAHHPYTFYGQLAIGQLGGDAGFNWQAPRLDQQNWQILSTKSKRVRRAAALAQAGRNQDAQEELRWAHGELQDSDDTALMALAFELDLWAAQVTMALASGAEKPENTALQAGLYPVPDFTPNGGFTVDRALLFGLIRQESKFMTDASSRVGATGLMQLMPRTASAVAGDRSLRTRRGTSRLEDPSYNMQLGQSYVETLLDRYTDGDLFEMALAYNWGPGNLRRFKKSSGIIDQLLLLESIPNPEARDFVEHVMTNFWIYRDRFDQEAPSREAAAAGKRPLYKAID